MAALYYDAFRQSFFVPKPTLTESNLPSQSGRVFIVTGGYAGCGYELSKLLYGAHATVYLAGRSESKATSAISRIRAAHPTSDGKLAYLALDLADLSTIKPAVQRFLTLESRLDVLTNNAGVMYPPRGSLDSHGHELQMGTNVAGPFLLTKLLTPLLQKTAAAAPSGSVRVTWAASMATLFSPHTGVTWNPSSNSPTVHSDNGANYAQSKAANALLAKAYHARYGTDPDRGIVTNAWNPGNLASELQRHLSRLQAFVISCITYPSVYGGYTELFAAVGEDAGKVENRGRYVGPWGRFVLLRPDLEQGDENAEKLWQWCESETREYA